MISFVAHALPLHRILYKKNFHPVMATFEAWSGPNIGRPAHPTKFWQCEEISNRCFCHVSWYVGHCISFQPIKRQSDLFSGLYGGLTLYVVYFYLFIAVRCIKSKDRNDILQSFG